MTDTFNDLNQTPRANRLHIGIYGRRNSGKSSLINGITGYQVSLVSDVAGTTTDPVYKSMEIYGIGPCVLIDTAGFDDQGKLGELRVSKTLEAVERTDMAVLVMAADELAAADLAEELDWLALLRQKNIPILAVISKIDLLNGDESALAAIAAKVERLTGLQPLLVSNLRQGNIEIIRQALIRLLPEDYQRQSIVGHLVSTGDTVLLVMPQDIQAPQGRLILPQVQTTRDLLDHHCVVISVTADQLPDALAALSNPPKLIITDSQVFPLVYQQKPEASLLTSFSVLFAAYKGDIRSFVAGAAAIDRLTETSRVLIAEACTHAPLSEDIGREKLPRLLRKKVGAGLRIDMVSGSDFPADLSGYDLIIHCGACMFNRKYVLNRIAAATAAQVPITNYGVTLAHISGILEKIEY